MAQSAGRVGSREGFTLIELLVVISIITTLAAILFPVFSSAKESGKSAACLANLRQIGAAIALYRDDYGGTNPPIWGGGTDTDAGSIWVLVKPYMLTRYGKGSKNLLFCPSAPWIDQSGITNPNAASLTNGFAYYVNETGYSEATPPPRGPGIGAEFCLCGPVRDGSVRRPAQLIYIAEGMGWNGYGIGFGDGTEGDNENPGQPYRRSGWGWTGKWPDPNLVIPFNGDNAGPHGGTKCMIYNLRVSHRGSTNCLMYDGHVKSMKTSLGKNWGNYYPGT